eukprot:TRINITY_DN111_c0_g1_i1.p2 TRINITY_DN111_c0_g1~~TRINITY_DN111_c0_g1_i1.p2  ORF type:complete len:131 (+),score=25.07 TRINITY_DN111_c0_g1_i1:166-558(+)
MVIEQYEAQENVWKVVPLANPVNPIRSKASAAVQVNGEEVLIFGGYHLQEDGSTKEIDKAFYFRMNEEGFGIVEEVEPMPFAASLFVNPGIFDDRVYSVGEEIDRTHNEVNSFVVEFNIITKSWTKIKID